MSEHASRSAAPRLGRGLDLPTVPQMNREHDHAATDATSTLENSRIVNAAIAGKYFQKADMTRRDPSGIVS